jgi:hypothetical protein
MELGGEGNELELPDGFPEAVQHIFQVPDHVSTLLSTWSSALTMLVLSHRVQY